MKHTRPTEATNATDANDRYELANHRYFYKFQERIYHIGIVISSNESGVLTVEGNTSGGPGVDANGGGVFQKKRSWTSLGSQGGFIKVY